MSQRPRGLLAAALALALTAAPARAQEPLARDRAATEGVDRPYHDYSGEGDASSLELNPALLQAVKGLDLALLGYRSVSPFTRGTGIGGFFALNLGLGFAAGLGVQAIRPGFQGGILDAAAARNPEITKLSFGLSGGDHKLAAFGVAVHGVRAAGAWLTRPDLDVGLLLRARNYASLGAAARFGPVDLVSQDLPPELALTGEIAVRPLGTRTLELAGGVRARFAADPSDQPLAALAALGVFPRARIALRWQGVELLGELEQVRAAVLDPQTRDIIRSARALRGSVALGFAWDFVHVRAGLHSGLSAGVDGFGGAARFSSAAQGRVYWPRPVDAERLKIGDLSDERDLIATLQRIDRAADAGARAVLVLEPGEPSLGWASLRELRQALIRVRDAGGHVFAYLEGASLRAYYLASAAEQIYIHPAGELQIAGISATTLYYKGALDKLGVQVEGLHIDEYKSAHEPYTRTGRSDPDRQQREAYLAATFDRVVYEIAQARAQTRAQVAALIDAAPLGPDQALDLKLVDAVLHRDELLGHISDKIGARVDFATFEDRAPARPTWSDRPYIAVVLVEGAIIDGKSRTIPLLGIHFAGADTISRALRELREDPACVGVVLRVNSPGGSALASDIIWREVERTHAAHERDPKRSPPIVVSMGDVAASGGYYVAVGARTVFAQPTTLTGSIGVVSLHFDVSGLLAKLGINADTLTVGQDADMFSGIYRPYTPEQRAKQMASMTRVYDLFRERVAAGRGLTPERVHELGRGHVYAGVDAHSLGLVDQLGGLHDAIAAVRAQAKIGRHQPVTIRVVPRERRLLDLILGGEEDLLDARRTSAADRRRGRLTELTGAALPLAVDRALARLPLSLLFLPQGRPSALMPAVLELDP
jgi:protease-4